MRVILQHPTGNRNVRAVLEGLAKAEMLAGFHTALSTDPKSFWLKVLPSKAGMEFLRRTYSLPPAQIHTYPLLELARLMMPKIGLARFTKGEHAWAGIDKVYRSLDAQVARKLPDLVRRQKVSAIYAYEDCALNTFITAKKMGLKCFYDLPIAYWKTSRKLLMEEAERLPAWAITLSGGILDSAAKLDRKTQELELADVVIGPSQFVIDSLPATYNNPRIIAPFGSPDAKERKFDETKKQLERPLRVLFAGSMSQRKGLGDLFAAFSLLKSKNLELVVMGTPLTTMRFYRSQMSDFVFEQGRPHDNVLELMSTCDVFCLPSIIEGRALVMQEAMSQGLPLIITPNTGGSDLIIDGSTGFLVPIRSPDLIAEKLSWFLENRQKIPEMGRIAQKHASRYTWKSYAENIISHLSIFPN